MANKYTTDASLKKIEDDIAYYKRSMESVRQFSRGGKDGLKAGIESLKEIRDTWIVLKNKALDNPTEENLHLAVMYRGKEEGIATAIGLFGDPDSQVLFYQQQVALLEKQLNEYKNLPKR